MKKTMKTTSVTITKEDWEWVKSKQKFTFSGLLAWSIEQHRKWDNPEELFD